MAVLPLREPTPAVGFDQPFEMLEACHERVERSLSLLGRLVDHLAGLPGAPDEAARQAATDVLRYFDVAAPLHHEDEEQHVFPRLEATGDPALMAAVQRLRADHLRFADDWRTLRTELLAVQAGTWSPARLATLRGAADAFLAGYADHLRCEHEAVFPAAAALVAGAGPAGVDALRAMGEEMAGRRRTR